MASESRSRNFERFHVMTWNLSGGGGLLGVERYNWYQIIHINPLVCSKRTRGFQMLIQAVLELPFLEDDLS